MSEIESTDDRRRKYPRFDIHGPIQVISQSDGESLGVVANMSVDGLMLAGRALDSDHLHQLTLKLPGAIEGIDSINLVVDCLWSSSSDLKTDIFWSGCHIIDYADSDISLVERIIEAQANSKE